MLTGCPRCHNHPLLEGSTKVCSDCYASLHAEIDMIEAELATSEKARALAKIAEEAAVLAQIKELEDDLASEELAETRRIENLKAERENDSAEEEVIRVQIEALEKVDPPAQTDPDLAVIQALLERR
jgi:protein-arginine kinase activator protein McsA